MVGTGVRPQVHISHYFWIDEKQFYSADQIKFFGFFFFFI